jgi:response regulator RpfG family c-di-GMP phosphodiesterase
MPDLAEKLSKLNRALRRLTPAQSPVELAEGILDVVDEVFGRDTSALLLVEPDGVGLRVAACRGYDRVEIQEYKGKVGEGISGSVAASGRARLVPDVSVEPDYIPGVWGALSEMAVPLLVEGRVLGVLDVESRRGAFDEEDVAVFTAFGEHAAWALRYQEAAFAAQERSRRLTLLNAAAQELNSSHDPEDLLDRILTLAHEALGFQSVAILLPQGPGGPLVVRQAQGRQGVLGLSLEPGAGIAGAVFASGRGEVIQDVTQDPRHIPGGIQGERSELVVPLIVAGATIGILSAASSQAGAFNSLDLEIFAAFGAMVATALRNAEQRREIERQAHRLRLINRAGRALNTRRNLDELIDEILRASDEAMGLGRVALLLLDPEGRELVVHSAVGYGDVIGKRLPLGKGVTGQVAVTGRPELVRDVREHAYYVPGVPGGFTEMAVPLRVFGELIGILDSESPQADAFSAQDLELFAAFADQVAVAIQNARLFKGLDDANARLQANIDEVGHLNRELETYANAIQEANRSLETQIRQLTTLHEAGQAITSSLDLNKTLEAILRMSAGIMSSSAGAIKLIDEETKELRIKAQAGVALDINGPFRQLDLPLRIGDKTIGVFELIRNASDEMDEGERKMLETLASQASIAIENARLFEDTQRIYYETLKSLARVMEARDDYTRGHSERVAELSLACAQGFGLSEDDCNIIFNSALLHDIGKIGVRDAVLLSDQPLSVADMDIIRKHPTYSNTILGPLKFLGQVSEYVKHHHESYDGSGYPQGLKGEAIPFFSRIITVADAYDAMTSCRPYREAKSHDFAVAEIRRMSGRQFDPGVVEVFLRVMEVGRP